MNSTDHTPDAPLDLATERARLTRAEAEFAELKAAVDRGELIPKERARQTITDAIDRMRDKLLALTDAMAPRLIGAPQADVEAMLMEAVHEALEELDAVAEAAFPEDDPKAGETPPETD